MNISQRTEVVLDHIRKAALAGDVCPSNKALAEALGMDDNAAAYAFDRLRREGVIESVRGRQNRKVFILGEGLETADIAPPEPYQPVNKGKRTIHSLQAASHSRRNDLGPMSDILPLRVGPAPKTCRFIHNDDTAAPDYCGEPVDLESYCQVHWDLCHTKREPKKRKRIDEGFVLFGRGVAA